MERRSGTEPSTARSALTFRIVLSVVGLLVWAAAAIVFALLDWPVVLVVIAGIVAMVALVDLVVVVRRKARGEPG
jgi:ABC-type bacteriocin/lantibiotic exporter with double-glycine peptidase domain